MRLFQYFWRRMSLWDRRKQNYLLQIRENGTHRLFQEDWLDVPFPNSRKFQFGLFPEINRDLNGNENWLDLVQLMNDMLIEEERWFDLGITSLEYHSKNGVVDFWYST